MGSEDFVQVGRQLGDVEEDRFDDEAVATAESGLVKDLDDGHRPVDGREVPLEQDRTQQRVFLELELDTAQQTPQEAGDIVGRHHLEVDDLEHRTVRRRHFRARPAADEQGNPAGGDLVGGLEGQDAIVVGTDTHAVVFLQDPPGRRE
ncbi:MAG: hypothetical protein J4F38_06550 [Pseudomonadales bacterium]|nr:hypothetical protein [Pseudomonadales bacterium]